MAIGRSVHVGVNKAKPNFDVRELSGCVGDAEKLFEIAKKKGFQATEPLLDGDATYKAVTEAIAQAAADLKAGDIFLFTFSGHGSFSTTDEEDDFQDELILLHDCLLPDNYMRRKLWSKFKKGVRILGIADCCHSGTAFVSAPVGMGLGIGAGTGVGTRTARGAAVNAKLYAGAGAKQTSKEDSDTNRGITVTDGGRIRKADPVIHKELDDELSSVDNDELKATLITLAACQDHEFAKDGPQNGAFTKRLIEVWNDNQFPGDYDAFMVEIQTPFNVPGSQQHPLIQKGDADAAFISQVPFTI